MSLTDVAVRTAKPKSKAYRLFDGNGLFLLVTTKGQRYWRYQYRYGGRRKLLALGVYPDVSLAEAREAHRSARKAVVRGEDPAVAAPMRAPFSVPVAT